MSNQKTFKDFCREVAENYRGKTLQEWADNAEENYKTTPISVLKYIAVMEQHIDTQQQAAELYAQHLVEEAMKEVRTLPLANQIEIVKDIANGMIGIGGVPSNKEFYAEFDMRVREVLAIPHWMPPTELPKIETE